MRCKNSAQNQLINVSIFPALFGGEAGNGQEATGRTN